MIAKAIDGLSSKIQKLEKVRYEQKPSNQKSETPSSPTKIPLSEIQCFFCKKKGHMKKDCKVFKIYMSKKRAKDSTGEGQKLNDLNKQGLGGRVTHPSLKERKTLVTYSIIQKGKKTFVANNNSLMKKLFRFYKTK